MVVREGYVLQHSSLDKIPLWVCEHVTPEEVRGNARRRNRFEPDPQLQGKPRSELADYRGSGFDRGHQAPAGNQNSSQRLKDETFFLSNMIPQVGANNQQIWADLEHKVRDWVEGGRVAAAFVVTGGFFYDPREEDPGTADGFIDFRQIGSGRVSVPTHIYKVVFAQGADEQWKAVAFVTENRGYPRPFDFAALIQPIDWLEERTGLDFLPDLDPLQEQQLEAQAGTLWDAP
jgi:DNA/RNA endonuclease G (NUC1)